MAAAFAPVLRYIDECGEFGRTGVIPPTIRPLADAINEHFKRKSTEERVDRGG